MKKSIDDQFDEIVQDFLAKMSAVKCDVGDYVAALKDAKSEIDIAIEAVGEDTK